MSGCMQKTLFILLLLLLFISVSGCSRNQMNSFNHFLVGKEAQEPGAPVFQKNYSSSSLSRFELDNLLNMSLYTGPPEKYGDIVFRERTARKRIGPVVFSHRTHRIRFSCRVCHTELEFSMKRGQTGITREDYLAGMYCGACHNGKIAFSVKYSCNVCHVKLDDDGNYEARTDALLNSSQLPAQDYGDGVNWVKLIENGTITPQNSIYQEQAPQSMPLPDHLELPLRWNTREPRTLVSFPHVAHTRWLDCANCHPDIFTIEQMGTVEFDKEKNLYGLYCGACHMTVAFPMNGCSRCHPGQRDRMLPPWSK